MARSTWSIRKLRELAMQRLGALAAQLKTKDELYDALAEHAPDSVGLDAPLGPKGRAKPKPAPAEPPRPVAVRVDETRDPRPETRASAAAESPPAPEITAPQRLPRKNKAREREVVRDFFVPPGTRPLPASFGDDRVMLFPRDPGGVFVSWDLSPGLWAHGGLWLSLKTHEGETLWSQEIHTLQGAVSIDGDFGGASLRAVLERGGSGVRASPAVLMPGTQREFAQRWRVRVEPDEALPLSAQRVGPEYGPPEAPAAVGEASRLLSTPSGPGAAPSHFAGPGAAPSHLAGPGAAPSRLGQAPSRR